VLEPDDIIKIDIRVNINGHVIDSAFTLCFDDTWDPLLAAAREATNVGIRRTAIDVRLCDIGIAIQEGIGAPGFDIYRKYYHGKPIANLCGYLIRPDTIHARKAISIIEGRSAECMEDGEFYASKTFGATGKGSVKNHRNRVSHFRVCQNPPVLTKPQQKTFFKTLKDKFSTLAFCQRFIEYIREKKCEINLRQLSDFKDVIDCPALAGFKSMNFSHENTGKPAISRERKHQERK
jgi:methionyl aminopeptidase